MSSSNTERAGVEVTMPETGAPEGAAVTAWLCRPGDDVEAGEVLCLVAWDGNVAALESPESGVLRMIAVETGREVPAGTTLARIETPAPLRLAEPEPESPEPEPEPPEPEPELFEPETEPELHEPEPEPEPEPELVATVPESLCRDAPVVEAAPVELDGFLSPAVRRFVLAHELDPGKIDGTGRGGRVTLADARAAADRATSG